MKSLLLIIILIIPLDRGVSEDRFRDLCSITAKSIPKQLKCDQAFLLRSGDFGALQQISYSGIFFRKPSSWYHLKLTFVDSKNVIEMKLTKLADQKVIEGIRFDLLPAEAKISDGVDSGSLYFLYYLDINAEWTGVWRPVHSKAQIEKVPKKNLLLYFDRRFSK